MRLLAIAILASLSSLAVTPVPAGAEDAKFMLCEALPHRSCVQNGDLFWLRGAAIRISDIRAPDRYAALCPAESILAWKSAQRLRDLLNAGPFELAEETSHDGGYVDEVLRIVMRDGKSIGQMLLDEGLAKPWSAEEPDWCVAD